MLQFKSKFPHEVLLCRVCLYGLFLPFYFVFTSLPSNSDFVNFLKHTQSKTLVIHYTIAQFQSILLIFSLFKVGDFYEAIGIDACILVEYAGLNPFGGLRTDSIPRAGCPVVVLISCS